MLLGGPPCAAEGDCPGSRPTPDGCLQGIDLNAGGRNKTVHRTAPKSENPYVKLLVKVSAQGGAAGPHAGPCGLLDCRPA